MGDLAADTAIEGSDGRYRAHLSRDWEIWGPNGGYLAVIAIRAAGAQTSLRRPATFSCHYLGVADSARSFICGAPACFAQYAQQKNSPSASMP